MCDFRILSIFFSHLRHVSGYSLSVFSFLRVLGKNSEWMINPTYLVNRQKELQSPYPEYTLLHRRINMFTTGTEIETSISQERVVVLSHGTENTYTDKKYNLRKRLLFFEHLVEESRVKDYLHACNQSSAVNCQQPVFSTAKNQEIAPQRKQARLGTAPIASVSSRLQLTVISIHILIIHHCSRFSMG